VEEKEFVSGTFILPPRADHAAILAEFEAVALSQANQVRGYLVNSAEARSVVTLYQGLPEDMKDSLMARTIPDMLAATLRCRSLSERDPSWSMFERKKVS
jgi:hypothetical protein